MISIGNVNKLRVVKEVDFGVYLDGEDKGEILLPSRYVPEGYENTGMIDAFIYLDSEDRLIATTEIPYARVGEFAFLKVVAVNNTGAFLDWNLPKDLLVPFREQKQKMAEGKSYLVFVYLDTESQRIAASSRLDKFLDLAPSEYTEGESVSLLISEETDLGFKAIVNQSHWGMLYRNEVFQSLEIGQKVAGFIKKVREDGKLDLCLQKPGAEKVDKLSERIIELLKEEEGFLAVTDKSSSQTIMDLFSVSKKTFKKAIGGLYKKKLILIEANGIRLV